MKKILFVNPSYRDDVLENVKILSLPPLNPGILASHTPDKYEIEIVDEAIDTIDFDMDVDLVAITCMTPLAPRAYEISTRFRENRKARSMLTQHRLSTERKHHLCGSQSRLFGI